jgi:flagellar motor switch protein FliG
VQNERLGRLERRSDEALRNLEEVMKASLAELNSKLEALGPIRIEP